MESARLVAAVAGVWVARPPLARESILVVADDSICDPLLDCVGCCRRDRRVRPFPCDSTPPRASSGIIGCAVSCVVVILPAAVGCVRCLIEPSARPDRWCSIYLQRIVERRRSNHCVRGGACRTRFLDMVDTVEPRVTPDHALQRSLSRRPTAERCFRTGTSCHRCVPCAGSLPSSSRGTTTGRGA